MFYRSPRPATLRPLDPAQEEWNQPGQLESSDSKPHPITALSPLPNEINAWRV